MKRNILVLILISSIAIILLYLKTGQQLTSQPVKVQETNQSTRQVTEASPTTTPLNTPTTVSANLAAVIGMTNAILNALTATNLEQWKAAIPGLKPLGSFTIDQHWLVEQPGRKNGAPIELNLNNQAIQYSAVLISVNAKNNSVGEIIEVQMQTLNMNINETRELGVQLCAMLGVDSKEFMAWCDKVGIKWIDVPLYATGKGIYGFQILNSFDQKKPWIINFIIRNQ